MVWGHVIYPMFAVKLEFPGCLYLSTSAATVGPKLMQQEGETIVVKAFLGVVDRVCDLRSTVFSINCPGSEKALTSGLVRAARSVRTGCPRSIRLVDRQRLLYQTRLLLCVHRVAARGR